MAKNSSANSAPRPLRRPSAVEARAAKHCRLRLWWTSATVVVVAAAVGLPVVLTGVGTSQASSGGGFQPSLPLQTLSTLGALSSPGSPGPTGSEGVPVPAGPVLAPPMTTGQTVDNIQCSTGEQVAFHIHSHLTIFVNGIAEEVPAAVGIANPQAEATAQGPFIGAGSCFYWLHTHAADGIIHVESPVTATYHLGQFFDIWGVPLTPGQVGPATGSVIAFYNGQHWTGDPRDIPLNAHAQIQLDVGTPLTALESIGFPRGL
ncbi:MAG TPA: hypothetical protein VHU85_06100 [Acidimicrobiales bacterium]|nr:hypothetical protein [Acidimicrobiales bacterium]